MERHPHRSSSSSAVVRLALMLVISMVAGVLAAGLAFPLVGGLGLAARSSAESFDELPSELTTPPLPQRSRILAADGSVLATVFLDEDRVEVPLARIPGVMRQAIIAVEDSRFYSHTGVDVQGLVRAAVENSQAGEVRQGGSTLTQQYVKNVLIQQATDDETRAAASETTITRKLQEARFAIALEKRLTKDEILERYLNIAYFGDGVYGVGTAATHYFNVPVEELTLPQAATLAGIVKSPVAFDPVRNPNDSQGRRDVVLGRMAEVGAITEPERAAAVASPLTLDVQAGGNGCATSFAPFYCDFVLATAQQDPSFGATPQERTARLFQGGLTIRTTLDPKVQAAAQNAVDTIIPPTPQGTEATEIATATVALEPGTGHVKAIATNRPYGQGEGQTTVNYATGRGGTGFQGGSTFKAFTLVEALKQGLPTSYSLAVTESIDAPEGCDVGESGKFNNTDPSEAGTYDMRGATADSINTYFVPLAKQIGVVEVARTTADLGITGVDAAIESRAISEKACSFTLGTLEVTPMEMAVAYGTLAAHGLRCRPVGILEVTTATGENLPLAAPDCQQVLEAGVADTVTDLLRAPIESGTARNADIGRPAAGKTGTTQNFAAAWFVGYTPQLATSVWVGDPRGGFQHPLIGVPGGTGRGSVVYGGGLPARVWASLMRDALDGVEVAPFAGADPEVANGENVAVPDVRGQSPDEAVAALRALGLDAVVSGGQVFDPGVRAGQTSGTAPRAGSDVPAGTRVTVLVSNGRSLPRPPAPAPPSPADPAPAPGPGTVPAEPTPPPPPPPAPPAAPAPGPADPAAPAARPQPAPPSRESPPGRSEPEPG